MKRSNGRYFWRITAIVAIGIAVTAAAWLVDYTATAFIANRSASTPAIFETGTAAAILSTPIAAEFSLHDEPRSLPEIQFSDDAGRARSLADFLGKIVVLNIWATWCGPCRREMPTLDRLQAALGGKDFQVVALSMDRAGLPVVQRFYAEVGVKHLAVYIDSSGAAARLLGAIGLPVTLLIDRQGREIGRLVGPAEWDAPEMITFIRNLLSKNFGLLTPAVDDCPPACGGTTSFDGLTFQPLETPPSTQRPRRPTRGNHRIL